MSYSSPSLPTTMPPFPAATQPTNGSGNKAINPLTVSTPNTQEAICIKTLLNKEPAWQPWSVAKTGFLFGGLLGSLLYISIGAIGETIRKQFAQISKELMREGQQANNLALKQLGYYVWWLRKQTPHLASSATEAKSSWKVLGVLALKGGVAGGLLGTGLTMGSLAEIKEGLRRQEADTEGNHNWLKSATWKNRLDKALKTRDISPLINTHTEQDNCSSIQHQQLSYRQWRAKAFSKSHRFNLLLAIGLLYSAGTMGLNAFGSKLILNKYTASKVNWVNVFKNLQTKLQHPIHIGEQRPWLKILHPLANCVPGIQNGSFTGMSIIKNTHNELSSWLLQAFSKASHYSNVAEANTAVLAFLETSQTKFFYNLLFNRYHPVALLQLGLTASLLSALLTVRNKWIVKKTERIVEKQYPTLTGQLGLLRLEEARRIQHTKRLKKIVAQQHFQPL